MCGSWVISPFALLHKAGHHDGPGLPPGAEPDLNTRRRRVYWVRLQCGLVTARVAPSRACVAPKGTVVVWIRRPSDARHAP